MQARSDCVEQTRVCSKGDSAIRARVQKRAEQRERLAILSGVKRKDVSNIEIFSNRKYQRSVDGIGLFSDWKSCNRHSIFRCEPGFSLQSIELRGFAQNIGKHQMHSRRAIAEKGHLRVRFCCK